MATHSSILTWKIPWTEVWQATVHGVAKLDTTVYVCVPAYTHTHTEWYLKMVQIIRSILCVLYLNFLSVQRGKLMP